MGTIEHDLYPYYILLAHPCHAFRTCMHVRAGHAHTKKCSEKNINNNYFLSRVLIDVLIVNVHSCRHDDVHDSAWAVPRAQMLSRLLK